MHESKFYIHPINKSFIVISSRNFIFLIKAMLVPKQLPNYVNIICSKSQWENVQCIYLLHSFSAPLKAISIHHIHQSTTDCEIEILKSQGRQSFLISVHLYLATTSDAQVITITHPSKQNCSHLLIRVQEHTGKPSTKEEALGNTIIKISAQKSSR